ncbi:MAG: dTDP-4-dehydrorhamnose reductase [Parachlamydiaceae bacterium]|nr:dTDP-4-dehydrorhamnose reductase [Parachlamydiaceae bacterium]
MKRILIFGKNGQVGWELQRTLMAQGHVTAVDRNQVDLTNPDAIVALMRTLKPQIVVNAAAYTAVDKAETEIELTNAVNGKAPGIMAEEAKKLDALFVHYSTDYVFDGKGNLPYREEDIKAPCNAYGHSKLMGEQAVQAVGGKFLILRTSWVYGMRGKNFLLTMLRLAKERPQLRVVDDQVGSPTWSRLIAQTTSVLLPQARERSGVYHLTSKGQTSWAEFAKKIFELQTGTNKIPEVVSIATHEYPTPAVRPAYSVLATEKLERDFNLHLPNWDDVLKCCVDSN